MASATNPNPDSTAGKPPRPRRRIPLTVKLFLSLLLLAGVGSALRFGIPAYRQRVAIKNIERIHGLVSRVPVTPDWVKAQLGNMCDGLFEEVTEVRLNKTYVADEDLANLKKMPHLKSLWLDDTQVTDAGFVHLGSLHKLETLLLKNTKVTDSGLKELATLNSLQRVSLAGTGVTDAGLAHLMGLSNLKDIDLSNTSVTGAGMAHLTRLGKLEWIHLSNTRVDDEGLRHLSKIGSLTSLWLDRTDTTDEGLAQLKSLKFLQNIQLDGTHVTGAGLAHLTDLKSFKYIWLDDQQIDKRVLEQLQKMNGLQQLLIPGPKPTPERLAELRQALPFPQIQGPSGLWMSLGRGRNLPVPEWFVRPIQPQGTPSEVLADLGVKVMAFEYRAPLAHKVTITFAARDENGEVIAELAKHSRTIAFRDLDVRGTVRLTLVDPSTFIEKYDGGRVHWIMKFGMDGGEFSGSAWTRNPFRLESGAVSWSEVAAVEDPVPGEAYTIWRCAARNNRLADGTPGPTVFDFEIRIQYEPMGPDDEDGTQTFTYGETDENERPQDDADSRE